MKLLHRLGLVGRACAPLIRRLAGAAAMLLALSVVVYLLAWIAPGDIAFNMLGIQNATPERLAEVNERYGFDRPFFVQYGDWLGGVFRGDLGVSHRSHNPVSLMLQERLAPTIALAALALLFSLIISIPLGFLAAASATGAAHPRYDAWVSGVTVLGLSAPSFALALLLLVGFAVVLPVFPLYGVGDGGWDSLLHFVLPALTLAIGTSAVLTKLTRAALMRELRGDSVQFARSRGVSQSRTNLMLVRNISPQLVTATALLAVMLSGGAVFVETAFSLPGIGRLLHQSILFTDIPTIQAIVLLNGVVVVCAGLLADLAVYVLDPRKRVRLL